jgi:hypothetical protein
LQVRTLSPIRQVPSPNTGTASPDGSLVVGMARPAMLSSVAHNLFGEPVPTSPDHALGRDRQQTARLLNRIDYERVM